MEIRCPNCNATQMTKGRIEFPCRLCGAVIRDPRATREPLLTGKYVSLDEVIRIARKNGVYRSMKEVLSLPVIEQEKGAPDDGLQVHKM